MFEERGSEDLARRIIYDIRHRTGILAEFDKGLLGFRYTALQEYLMAQEIALYEDKDLSHLIDLFLHHLPLPAWREVLKLSLGVMATVQHRGNLASSVLNCLLDASVDWARRNSLP